jgi:hypothetical protein
MCDWIVRAWNIVSTKIITKSLLKTGITNDLVGSEDEMWVGDENVDAERDSESAPESSSEDDNSDE